MSERSEPEAHLKAGSIGFVDALVIGLNATSPAYSLAAVIGPIVALAGRAGDHDDRGPRPVLVVPQAG